MGTTARQLAEAAAFLAQEALFLSRDLTLSPEATRACGEMAFTDHTDRGSYVEGAVALLRDCGSDGSEVVELLAVRSSKFAVRRTSGT